MGQTIDDIKALLAQADWQQYDALERSLAADTRKGVRIALSQAKMRLEKTQAEQERLQQLVGFQEQLAATRGASIIVGLDEVGRGPLAGPLAVGAVVLPPHTVIEGINDSKKLSAAAREQAAERIKEIALAWSVVYIQPDQIDAAGMTACLVTAFRRALADIEKAGIIPDIVLLDGNPLRMDSREVNVIKGDGKCASIACASIVAKVERDALMCRLDEEYPAYGFASNKGYGSADHIEAIKRHGLSPVHRVSFCSSFDQPTLF